MRAADRAAAQLLERASAGDEAAFGELVDPYRRELQVHSYRIVGSVQDAEDLVQETCWRRGAALVGLRAAPRCAPGSTGSPRTVP